jgi:Bacterial DNA-binding protein
MLFFAPFATRKITRKPKKPGVFQDGEKGWSSDQVGNPQPDRKRNLAVPQECGGGVRFSERSDQEEPARARSLHKKPATKAREGINPFTGEKMMFKAKPASKKVRAMPLKNLKAMVN